MSNLNEYSLKSIGGQERKLSEFGGKVCLLVNVASECGLTPQYDGLQRLYAENRDRDFEILAFPCNQFGGQEPGSEAEIERFCRTNFGVEFPMFEKIEVNGEIRLPLYAWLTGEDVGPDVAGDVAWNFAKFLVDQDGHLVARFAPSAEPCSKEISERIDALLEKS